MARKVLRDSTLHKKYLQLTELTETSLIQNQY